MNSLEVGADTEVTTIEVATEVATEATTIEEVREGETEAALAICKMICGGGIMKLSALLIPTTSSKDPETITIIVAVEAVIGTIIILVIVKEATKTIEAVKGTKSHIISDSKKMDRKATDLVAGTNKEERVAIAVAISKETVGTRRDIGSIPEVVVTKSTNPEAGINREEKAVTKMVCRDLVAAIKKVAIGNTISIPEVVMAINKRVGTNLVAAINKETVIK
jgi:hypothetical protein